MNITQEGEQQAKKIPMRWESFEDSKKREEYYNNLVLDLVETFKGTSKNYPAPLENFLDKVKPVKPNKK